MEQLGRAEIRTYEQRDLEALGPLLSLAFGGGIAPAREYYDPQKNPRVDLEQVYVAELDGEARATATVLPMELSVDGRAASFGGVAAVTTHPAYRRRRLAGDLMRAALGGLRERGVHLSMLDPFEHEFYRAYGWELTNDTVWYRLDPRQLSTIATGSALRSYRSEDLPRLRQLYEEYGARHQLCVRRGEAYWKKLLADENRGVAVYEPNASAGMEGYLIYQQKEWSASREQYEGREKPRTLVLQELVWHTPEARRALLSFAAAYDPADFDVWQMVSPGDRLHPQLRSSHVEARLQPDNMLRLVDVAGALNLLRRESRSPLVLEVEDETLPQNTGSYTLGNGAVVRGAAGAAAATVRLDVRQLAQLYAGYLSAGQLHRYGLIRPDSEQALRLLEEFFPVGDPWLFPLDHF